MQTTDKPGLVESGPFVDDARLNQLTHASIEGRGYTNETWRLRLLPRALTLTSRTINFAVPSILSSSEEILPHRPIITLTTDFGTNDHFVGAVKGVILTSCPRRRSSTLLTPCRPSTCSTARWRFPSRIRTSRTERFTWSWWIRAWAQRGGRSLASSDGYHFVAPDNGVLSMVYAKEERIHVRHITSDHYFRQPVSNTFHARDVFAPGGGISGEDGRLAQVRRRDRGLREVRRAPAEAGRRKPHARAWC